MYSSRFDEFKNKENKTLHSLIGNVLEKKKIKD